MKKEDAAGRQICNYDEKIGEVDKEYALTLSGPKGSSKSDVTLVNTSPFDIKELFGFLSMCGGK